MNKIFALKKLISKKEFSDLLKTSHHFQPMCYRNVFYLAAFDTALTNVLKVKLG